MPNIQGSNQLSNGDNLISVIMLKANNNSMLSCPIGRYRYIKLLFRAASAGDIFYKKIDELFSSIPNIFGIADDILIPGFDKQGKDHEETL